MSLIFDDWNICTDSETGEVHRLNWDDLESVPFSKSLGIYCEAIRQAYIERLDSYTDLRPPPSYGFSFGNPFDFSSQCAYKSNVPAYRFFNWMDAAFFTLSYFQDYSGCFILDSTKQNNSYNEGYFLKSGVMLSPVISTYPYTKPIGALYPEAGKYRKQEYLCNGFPCWKNEYSEKYIWISSDQTSSGYYVSPFTIFCGELGDKESSIIMQYESYSGTTVGSSQGGTARIEDYQGTVDLFFASPTVSRRYKYNEDNVPIFDSEGQPFSSVDFIDSLKFYYDILRYTNCVRLREGDNSLSLFGTIKYFYQIKRYENPVESFIFTATVGNCVLFAPSYTDARTKFSSSLQFVYGPLALYDYTRSYSSKIVCSQYYRKFSTDLPYSDFGLNRDGQVRVSSAIDYTGGADLIYCPLDTDFPMDVSGYTSSEQGFINNYFVGVFHDLRDENGTNGGFNFSANDVKYT